MGMTSVHNMDGDDEQAGLYAALEQDGELIRPDVRPLQHPGGDTPRSHPG